MKGIRIENGFIIYYGNAAGYVSGERAVVDSIFVSDELERFLKGEQEIKTIQWKEGVFKQLSHGKQQQEEIELLKSCRVWQLKPESDIMMRFIGYEEMINRFGEPSSDAYQVVYDGTVASNELEVLYETFNLEHPAEYTGHSLSMSDVVELYDEQGSKFYYCDMIGFREIAFQDSEQSMQMKF